MVNIVGFILMAGIIITMLILLSLLSSTNKDYPKTILIIFFTFTLFVNISAYASLHDLSILYTLTFIFDFSIVWLIGPLLLIYIRSLFEEKTVVIKSLVHFLPVILLLLFVGFPLVASFLIPAFQPDYLSYLDSNQSIIIVLRDIYCIVYLSFAIKEFNAYKAHIKHAYSGLSGNDFSWIIRLLALCLAFIILDVILNVSELFLSSLPFHSGFLIICFIIVVTIYLGYFGIKQSTVLLPSFLMLKLEDQKPVRTVTFTHDKKIESFKSQFIEQLKKEKYYREEDLSLHKLAGYFEMTDKEVSVLLNKYIGLSFYDFINSLRIEEVKQKLVNPAYDHYTILSIAFDSGFNSKATFNRIFKKETGITPSRYQKINRHK